MKEGGREVGDEQESGGEKKWETRKEKEIKHSSGMLWWQLCRERADSLQSHTQACDLNPGPQW